MLGSFISWLPGALAGGFSYDFFHAFRVHTSNQVNKLSDNFKIGSSNNMIFADTIGNYYVVSTTVTAGTPPSVSTTVHSTVSTRTTSTNSIVEVIRFVPDTNYYLMGTTGQTSIEYPKLIRVDISNAASTVDLEDVYISITEIAWTGSVYLTGPYLKYRSLPSSAGITFGDGSSYATHKYRYITCASTTACYAERDDTNTKSIVRFDPTVTTSISISQVASFISSLSNTKGIVHFKASNYLLVIAGTTFYWARASDLNTQLYLMSFATYDALYFFFDYYFDSGNNKDYLIYLHMTGSTTRVLKQLSIDTIRSHEFVLDDVDSPVNVVVGAATGSTSATTLYARYMDGTKYVVVGLNNYYTYFYERKACHPDCLTCYGPNSDNCKSCRPGASLKTTTCITCEQSCRTCSTSNPLNCSACFPGMYLYSTNGITTCVECNTPNRVVSGNNCLSCSSSCLTCSLSTNNCTSCPADHYLNPFNNCVTCTFMSEFFIASQSKCSWCLNIMANCDQCSPGGLQCWSCSGFFYDGHAKIPIGNYASKWRERLAIKMWTGWPTFPQVFVRGTFVGGRDLTTAMLKDGTLRAMLDA